MSEWINSEDSLPKNSEYCICHFEGGQPEIMKYEDGHWWSHGFILGCPLPTHWMPLPEPPK